MQLAEGVALPLVTVPSPAKTFLSADLEDNYMRADITNSRIGLLLKLFTLYTHIHT